MMYYRYYEPEIRPFDIWVHSGDLGVVRGRHGSAYTCCYRLSKDMGQYDTHIQNLIEKRNKSAKRCLRRELTAHGTPTNM